MTREAFMNRLASLLSDMPVSEREEALQYYNDYFDDAGIENQQRVIEELGSPENVAAAIKGQPYDGPTIMYPERVNMVYQEAPKNNNDNNLVLWIIIGILLSPVIIPAVSAAFGVLIGIVGAAVGIAVALVVCGIVFFVAAIACIICAFTTFAVSPAAGAALLGAGFLLIGLSFLGIWLTVGVIYLCYLGIPVLWRGIKSLWGKIFKKKNVSGGNV